MLSLVASWFDCSLFTERASSPTFEERFISASSLYLWQQQTQLHLSPPNTAPAPKSWGGGKDTGAVTTGLRKLNKATCGFIRVSTDTPKRYQELEATTSRTVPAVVNAIARECLSFTELTLAKRISLKVLRIVGYLQALRCCRELPGEQRPVTTRKSASQDLLSAFSLS